MKSFFKINLFLYLIILIIYKTHSVKLLDDNLSNTNNDKKPTNTVVGIRLPKMSKCNEENREKCKEMCKLNKNSEMCFCFQFEGKTNLKCACKNERGKCPRF